MSAAEVLDLTPAPEPSFYIKLQLNLVVHLEALSPLARKTYYAAADLTRNRPHWRLSAASIAAHIHDLFGESPHPDSVRRALKALRRADLLAVVDDAPGCNRYRVRIAGIHEDAPHPVKGENGSHNVRAVEGSPCNDAGKQKNADFSAPLKKPVKARPRPQTKPVRTPRTGTVRTPRIPDDPAVARDPQSEAKLPLVPRTPPPKATPEGGGDDRDRLVTAWSDCGGSRPVTRATAAVALSKAHEANPTMDRAAIVENLCIHAETTSIPDKINEPLLWMAGRDLSEKPRRPRRFAEFSDEPREPVQAVSAAQIAADVAALFS